MRYLILFYSVSFLSFVSSLSVAQEKRITIEEFKNTHAVAIEALKKSARSESKAAEILEKWTPEDEYFKTYKKFWSVLWVDDFSAIRSLYEDLKKQKKYIRLRMELLKTLFREAPVKDIAFLTKESRLMLRQLRGTSEGEMFESTYLKWLGQNKYYAEICSSERLRWIAEPEIDFIEMITAVESCPMKFEDFLVRLRRLIFAAKEFQAQREIEILSKNNDASLKIEDWQKTYLQAIFDSHVGDPVKAFQNLSKFETEILKTDYDDNYFYISQRAGELKNAEQLIQKVIERALPKDKRELRFQEGFLFYQTKQYDKAYKVFDTLYKNHTHKKKKRKNKDYDQIGWLRAWVLFLDQKYDKSLKAFNETKSYANDTARLNYWIGVNLLKLEDISGAQSIFKHMSEPIVLQKSFSFYNLLAWLRHAEYKTQFKNNDILKNLIAITKSPNSIFPAPDDQISRSQLLEQYNDLADESFVTDEGQIQVVNSENEVLAATDLEGISVDTKTELQNQIFWAQLLIDNNQPDLAKWHLFELEKNLNDRKKSDMLVQFYLDQKFYYRALSFQQKLGMPEKTVTNLKSDTLIWNSLYPQAYKNDVQLFSEQRKIEPFLLWSIMRAETQYKADAISPVGAIGLMQFMPYTAQKVGSLISQTIQNNDLFKPERSIEFGAAYIKKLSNEFQSQAPLMVSAYNGGPHRVKQWLKNLGQVDYDVFIEHIPFAETRTYTKRVLTFKSMYEKIYGSGVSFDKNKYLIERVPFSAPEGFKLSEEWQTPLK